MEKTKEQPEFGVGTYLKVFAALMVLLAITVGVAFVDLGPWNIIIAMVIAVVKAGLVVLYFMQAKRSAFIIKMFAGAAAAWLVIATILTFSDYATRRTLKENAVGVVTVESSRAE